MPLLLYGVPQGASCLRCLVGGGGGGGAGGGRAARAQWGRRGGCVSGALSGVNWGWKWGVQARVLAGLGEGPVRLQDPGGQPWGLRRVGSR